MKAETREAILQEPLGVSCPGCGVDLTVRNSGGYRCYCEKCVDAMPTFPTDGRGYVIEGTYPNFRWVAPSDGEIPTRAVGC